MKFNRTKNAKRIIMSGLVIKIFAMIIPFAMRTIIIYTLGTMYLGLNSLFSSILNALNLAELGVGSALVFSMYKPVANDDKKTIKALLNIYKKAYLCIGTIVVTIGIVLVPFLPKFIKGDYPHEINIYLIFIMQLISTVAGYFFMAYKSSVLIAYQRSDIINLVTFVTEVVMYSFQALALILWKNYYLYIGATVIRIIIQNLTVAFIVKRKYPDLVAEGSIDKQAQKEIFKKTGALLGHKIATVVINSLDNIFISMFISLEMVAIYNNYYYILNAVSGLLLILINGLQSIVGNYLISNNKEDSEKMFHMLQCIVAFLVCFCSTCLMNLYQPFMIIWTGENMLLPILSVALFSVYFFTLKIRSVTNLFIDAAGLWEKNIICSYIIIIIDLVLDLWLLRVIGVNGAIISSIVSMIFSFLYDSIVLYKYCFKTKSEKHFSYIALYTFVTVLSSTVAYLLCNILPFSNKWIILISSLIVSTITVVCLFSAFAFRIKPFKDSVQFVKKRILKRTV